jgi:hypothetical protein
VCGSCAAGLPCCAGPAGARHVPGRWPEAAQRVRCLWVAIIARHGDEDGRCPVDTVTLGWRGCGGDAAAAPAALAASCRVLGQGCDRLLCRAACPFLARSSGAEAPIRGGVAHLPCEGSVGYEAEAVLEPLCGRNAVAVEFAAFLVLLTLALIPLRSLGSWRDVPRADGRCAELGLLEERSVVPRAPEGFALVGCITPSAGYMPLVCRSCRYGLVCRRDVSHTESGFCPSRVGRALS